MKYIKTVCHITPDNEVNRDLLMAALGEIGYDSFVDEQEYIEAFIQEEIFNASAVENGALNFDPLYQVTTSSEAVAEQNWNQVWEEETFKEIIIADKILIRAVGPENDSDYAYQIEIIPNMSFGTGDHETTAMILEKLMYVDCQDKQVLDMGCGTGILGIMTAKRGAAHVDAIDIDHWCYESTTQNSEINNVVSILNPIHGDVNSIPEGKKYDIILANIHKNILIQDMHRYAASNNIGGELFLSGFYTSDTDDLIAHASKLGYKYLETMEKDSWAVLRFVKEA